MWTRSSALGLAAGLALLAGGPAIAGDLNPPGAPGSTMKTLDEVEPRIPITAADLPLTISQPGSYYFTETIETTGGGITILSSDVTVDLMGHALLGGSGTAISSGSGTENIAIRNGSIGGWSSGGIVMSQSKGVQIDGVLVRDVNTQGIWTGQASLIRNCTVIRGVQSGNSGAFALAANTSSRIVDCVVRESGGGGVWLFGSRGHVSGTVSTTNAALGFRLGNSSTMESCRAMDNGSSGVSAESSSIIRDTVSFGNNGWGISAVVGVTMDGVNVRSNASGGISAGDAATITDSAIYLNNGIGVRMLNGGSIIGCNVNSNQGSGIRANSALIRSNTVRDNSGSGVSAGESSIIDNQCVGNQASGIVLFSHSTATGNSSVRNGEAGILQSGAVPAFTRIERNFCVNNGIVGIELQGVSNSIVSNTADSYNIPGFNQNGGVTTSPSSASAWANIRIVPPPSR